MPGIPGPDTRAEGEAAAHRRPVVLLVDGDHEVAESFRQALAHQPLEILTAGTVAAGLDLLAGTQVDVVVTDERMPYMSGVAFLTRVRAEYPEVERIILASEATMEATVMAINDAQVFRFLTKPCPADRLVAAIDDALAASPGVPAGTRVPRRRRHEDRTLDRHLTEALATARVVYQPIVEADDHTLFAHEALLRVDHPVLASPGQLVQAATVLGRRFDLDRTVRSLVATDLATTADDTVVFVNLLPESLDDGRLLAPEDPLADRAHQVVLEITERAPLDTIGDVEAKLDRLRRHGYRLALDDLGAGYAGLSSLATMHPEVVKFERTLIVGIDQSPTRSKLVSALIVVCQELGATTLAEGVETEAELTHLRELGCDLVQGYAISRPRPRLSSRSEAF